MPKYDTPFATRCYALLRQVPSGYVTTYSDLAHALGSRAYRAVGTIMANNPDLIATPCHRVVKKDASVGAYARGSSEKIRLLEAEGITIKNGKVINFETLRYRFDSLLL